MSAAPDADSGAAAKAGERATPAQPTAVGLPARAASHGGGLGASRQASRRIKGRFPSLGALPPGVSRSHSFLPGRAASLRLLRASLPRLRTFHGVESPKSPGSPARGPETKHTPSPVPPLRAKKKPKQASPAESVLALLLDRPVLDRKSYLALAATSRRLHTSAMAPHRWPGVVADWWFEEWLEEAVNSPPEDEDASLCDSLLDRLFETNLLCLSDPLLPPVCLPAGHMRQRPATESLRIVLPSDPASPPPNTHAWAPLGLVPRSFLRGAPPELLDHVVERLSRTVFARLLAREASLAYPDDDVESLDHSQQLAFLQHSLAQDRALVLSFLCGYLPLSSLSRFSHLLAPESEEWHPAATPVHVAAARGRRDAVALLRGLGWDAGGTLPHRSGGGFEGCVCVPLAPVEHALFAGHAGTARYLLKHGATGHVERRGEACAVACAWVAVKRGNSGAGEPGGRSEASAGNGSPETGIDREDEDQFGDGELDAVRLAERGSRCARLALDVIAAANPGWKPGGELWREVGIEMLFAPREVAEAWGDTMGALF